MFTAAANAIWAKHGLAVDLVEPFPGPSNAKAVAAGRYDVCVTSVAHFVRAKYEEPALAARFVFMIARETHLAAFVIDGRPGVHGQPIRGIKGLAGASYLGERESFFVREYLALLRRLELEPGTAVAVPYEEQFEALARGKADVGIDFLDLRPRFEAALESGQRLRPLPFFEAGIHLYGSGLVASTRLIEARPEAIRRLVSALREALFATRDDPAAGLAELCRRFPATDRERAIAGWRAGSPLIFGRGELGAMERETWQRTLEHFAVVHDASPLEVEAVFDGVFVNAPAEGVAAARP